MFCGNCGNELEDGWVKCPYCEAVISDIAYTEKVLQKEKDSNGKKQIEAKALSMLNELHYKVCFYQDLPATDTLMKDIVWKRCQEGYKKYIQNTVLDLYFIRSMPCKVDRVFARIVKKCVKKFEQNLELLFVINEDKGLLLLSNGLFINDCFIPFTTLKSILLYHNIIFINRIAFELHTVQEADILFEFVTFLFPQIKSARETSIEEAVEKLRILEHENYSDSGEPYFYKIQQYKDYVARMSEEYVQYYLKLHPEVPYSRYLEVKKRQDILSNALAVISVILPIILAFMIGIKGFLIGMGIFIAFIIWQWKERWRKPFAKLIPEEMDNILIENEYHIEKISLLEYRHIIDTMKEQLGIS